MKLLTGRAGITIAVLLTAGAITASITHAYYKHPINPTFNAVTMSFDQKMEYWTQQILTDGGPAAYLEFAEAVKGLSYIQQHDEGHIFGDVLYRVEGLPGIAACDGRFHYSCFHAFSIRGVQEKGADGAQELYDACRNRLGPTSNHCEHGIGHGILGLFGGDYSFDELQEALATCDSLTPASNPTHGCAGGVFMEYAVHSMNTGSTNPRLFSEEEKLEPCVSLPQKYREPCAFWQPMWWLAADAEASDGQEMAQRMGLWCKEMSERIIISEHCIRGIAHMMLKLTHENPSDTVTMCEAATSNRNHRYLCHQKSAERVMYYHSVDDSLLACDGLTKYQRDLCTQKALANTKGIRRDMEKYRSFEEGYEVFE
jgi:hypothetical protein